MAATAAPERAHSSRDDEDLTDEQVDALLARATARLKAKSQSQEVAQTNTTQETYTFPKLQTGKLEKPYVSTSKHNIATADSARLVDDKQRKKANGIRRVEEPVKAKKLADEQKKSTTGPLWYDLPKTQLTPALKRDLQLLKMRSVLDPHRHYKKDGGKMQPPEYSQVGTIVEGPTEFFSGRIENRKRKRTFVEEVLAGEQETQRFKKKYGELQGKKTSGKKAFYRKLREGRRGGVRKGG